MSKGKIFFIVGMGAILLVILGTLVFLRIPKPASLINPLSREGAPAKIETGKLLFYEDEAGFSFQYPGALGIVEKDIGDTSVYSSLELSSKNYPGEKMIIKITDTDILNIEKYLEKNPQTGNLLASSEITLGGMKGKSFQHANPAQKLILVIDSGILYYLEAPFDNGFWEKALETISSSFRLTEEKTTTSTSGASVIEEEEEVIW